MSEIEYLADHGILGPDDETGMRFFLLESGVPSNEAVDRAIDTYLGMAPNTTRIEAMRQWCIITARVRLDREDGR